MHSVAKWNQSFQDFAYGMRCHFGVDATLGLVHSVVSTAANLPELSTDAERLHGDEKIVHRDWCYQDIAKRTEMAIKAAELRVAMRTGKRRPLPNTRNG